MKRKIALLALAAIFTLGVVMMAGCEVQPSETTPTVFFNFTKDKSTGNYSVAAADVKDMPEEITLRSTYKGQPVSAIGASAFEGCGSLITVIIPDGIKSIGEKAFKNCANLSVVTVPASVNSIGENAFSDCANLTVIEYGGTIEEWNAIDKAGYSNEYSGEYHISCADGKLDKNEVYIVPFTADGYFTFDYIEETDSFAIAAADVSDMPADIKIPEEHEGMPVTAIADGAFMNCAAITSVIIPDSVTSIGTNAFRACSGLSVINIPENVATIGDYAFRSCYNIENIDLPDSVWAIGVEAFGSCTKLGGINIGAGVGEIGEFAFAGCGSLAEIEVDEDNANYSSIDGNLYDKTGSVLIQYATGKADEEFEISDSVAEIAPYAFAYCVNLKGIVVSATDLIIGENAFEGCAFESAKMPMAMFSYIDKQSLSTAWITVGNVAENAFAGCENLETVIIPEDASEIGAGAFGGSGISTVAIPESISVIGANAFKDCANLHEIAIPDGASIGENAFDGCVITTAKISVSSLAYIVKENLVNVEITSGNIGDYMFRNCTNLVSVVLSEGVTGVGYSAFYGCTSLVSVVLPASVTAISGSAFGGCASLESITVPASIDAISGYVFYNCASLTTVNYGGTAQQWEELDKGEYWNYGTGEYIVKCSDGDLDKEGNQIIA